MLEVDGVLDIETEDWDQFVLGGLLNQSEEYEEFRCEESMATALLRRGGTWWTWNGGLFDTLWLGEIFRRRGLRYKCAVAGTRVTRLECEGLIVRDAVALIPMSLSKAAKIAGDESKAETGLPCVCDKGCGGYCSIRRGMPESFFKRLSRYLQMDCRVALRALVAVLKEAERCEYLLTGTVGGSSYKTAEKMAGLEPAEWDTPRQYYAARGGYYGGRVEVGQPVAERGFALDLNSAYPAALVSVDLPTGARVECAGARAQKAYRRGLEGIYLARVNVPKGVHVPLLPRRTPKGRVVYPNGQLVGRWTALELRRAEEFGWSVQVDSGLVWLDSERVLAPILLHVWQCRARARDEGNVALYQWHKWFGNSVTGKLAENPDKEVIIVCPSREEIRVCRCEPDEERCTCKPWRPMDAEGDVWAAPFWRLSNCSHVHWAAYLTAWTRIELHTQVTDDGQEGRTWVYCDTDSCYTTQPRTRNLGDDLGQWKNEGRFKNFLAVAPKMYRYYRDPGGDPVVRAKGLAGVTADDFDRFIAGHPVHNSRGVMGIKSAARSGGTLFRRKSLSRSNRATGTMFGGRRLGPDGRTHPLAWQEVLKWEAR